ncbi:hypothetical protein T492DRAFT_835686 [Pavlovales sp. CCMP2436]|nr:hypothetical protein T492DRAFT_835686 [Pavlovales sp. CCMP2436]
MAKSGRAAAGRTRAPHTLGASEYCTLVGGASDDERGDYEKTGAWATVPSTSLHTTSQRPTPLAQRPCREREKMGMPLVLRYALSLPFVLCGTPLVAMLLGARLFFE